MAEIKFTPGPWEADRETQPWHGGSVPAIAVFKTVAGHGWPVAWAHPYCCESRTIQADAHLIAAAPEMYDMLATIENDDGKIPDWLWKKIQDVLAKARGE